MSRGSLRSERRLSSLLEPDRESEQRLVPRNIGLVDEAPDLRPRGLSICARLLDCAGGDVNRDVRRKTEQVRLTAARAALVRPDGCMTQRDGERSHVRARDLEVVRAV